MRRLYLTNEVGTFYFFDFSSRTLIEEIDGLGFEFDLDYQDFGSSYVESKRKIPQKTISFKLFFLDGYAGFVQWREYVTKSKNLKLVYSCDGVKYCYVNVRSSSKAQLEAGILKSSVELDRLSLWLVDKEASIVVDQSSEGKTYPYTYTHLYSISFNGKTIVQNDCSRSVPVKIKIVGNVFNPRVIIRQNGEAVTSMRLLLDEREFPTIEISSDPTDQYIKKVLNGQETDIYQYQDFSYDNFLFLPPGASEIFFDPGVWEASTCFISFSEEYVAH